MSGVYPLRRWTKSPVQGRSFNGSSDKLVDTSQAVVTGRPATICAFVKRGATGTERALLGVDSSSSNTPLLRIGVRTGGQAFAQYRNDVGDGGPQAISSTVLSDVVFSHVCGLIDEGTDGIKIYFNGVHEGTQTVSQTTSVSLNQMAIGVLQRTSPAQFFNGELAGVAVWNVILTEAEIRKLAAGASPAEVRPENLVHFPDLGSPRIPDRGRAKVNYAVTGTLIVPIPVQINKLRTIWMPLGVAAAGGASVVLVQENVDLTAAFATVVIRQGTMSGQVDLADAITVVLTATAVLSEPVDLTDSNAAISTAVAAISEAVDLGESWAAIAQVIAATTETVDLGETWTTGGLIAASLSENVDLASTFANTVVTRASVSEQTDLTDLYGVVLTATASVSEPVDLANAYSALLQAGASISEAITLAATFAATAGEIAAAVRILVEARNRRIMVEPRDRRIIAKGRNRRIDVKKLN